MSRKELQKVYKPHEVEDHWLQRWIDQGLFSASSGDSKENYSIVIPPPNVTGSLHMGHALNTTIQDILIRYHRMKGDNTLWVLGTDHAGIATQNVVEKQLVAEGKSRFDLGRDEFVKRVWKWRKESGGVIINQLKRLGASCDYANERFTMDEGLSAAVKKVFVELHKKDLIYRGLKLINWCPRCHTALSDLEVEHSDQKGHLWHIKYPVARDSPARRSLGEGGSLVTRKTTSDKRLATSDYLIVATTRPETMLGDTAVAVHPDDERYKGLIGKNVILPLVEKEIPIIADEYVDKEFGSGVVKITPAHDFNDFEVGNRHRLERVNILTEDGKINENGGPYSGLSVQAARKKVVEDLESKELLEKIEPYKNAVGHCYRCKAIVEPYLSYQWFVKAKTLAGPAVEAVKNEKTRFVPKHWEKTYFNWMENIQDWCISRQIWWGHQIPAWYCEKSEAGGKKQEARNRKQETGSKKQETKRFCEPIVSETVPKKCPKCGSTKLTQDQDVLDTWFSSALWPFSTLGWTGKGGETPPLLKTFYPTSVLVTAFDIIFFWVARMMMMGIHFMKEVPFRDVHIHAIVRDPLGQKMSKSKGNVVDPLLMMKKYGTDAFRFALSAFAAQGRDIRLDEARIEGYRNFCNKVWNASRFAFMNADPFIKGGSDFRSVEPKNKVNQWIILELSRAIQQTSKAIGKYEFNRAASAVYSFFWHDFCDWYLELSKEIYKEGREEEKIETARTTFHVLDVSLRLLHPFMPFITEEIWQMLSDRKGKSIVKSNYPVSFEVPRSYQHSWEEIQLLIDIVSTVRGIRQETGVPLSKAVSICLNVPKPKETLYREVETMIFKLGKINKMDFISGDPAEPSAIARSGECIVSIPIQGLIDVAKEKARQAKKLSKVEKDIKLIEKRLADSKFVDHAPKELVAEKKLQLTESLSQKKLIEKALQLLEK